MATKLKKMRLTSVDLVRAGANQEADICLFKSADPPEATESPAEAEIGIFKRFLNWLRENPTEAENEPHSHIEKGDDLPDLEYIYKSALSESLQSIMADETLTEIEKKDMTEESLRQYAEKIQELERRDEEEDRLEGDIDHDDPDDDDEDEIEEIEEIEEVVESRKSDDGFYDYIEESQIRKYNHNHGADGKFSSSPGAGGGGSASVNGSGTQSSSGSKKPLDRSVLSLAEPGSRVKGKNGKTYEKTTTKDMWRDVDSNSKTLIHNSVLTSTDTKNGGAGGVTAEKILWNGKVYDDI